MTVRTISCFLIAFASPVLPWPDSHSRAAVVIPDLGHPWLDESPMPPVDVPQGTYVPCPASDSASTGSHAARPWYSPPYFHRPSVPHTRSPYAPPPWTSPWNRGYLTYGTPVYYGLPPVPTAPQYEGARYPLYMQPWSQNWAPSPGILAPVVPQASIRKPFSGYRPPRVISPYLYLNQDDPFGMTDYYFFVRPQLEGQELDQP